MKRHFWFDYWNINFIRLLAGVTWGVKTNDASFETDPTITTISLLIAWATWYLLYCLASGFREDGIEGLQKALWKNSLENLYEETWLSTSLSLLYHLRDSVLFSKHLVELTTHERLTISVANVDIFGVIVCWTKNEKSLKLVALNNWVLCWILRMSNFWN